MSTAHFLNLLIEERNRLERAIDALGGDPDANMPDWVKKAEPTAKTRKGMSAAGRKAIRDGARKPWATIKAAKAEAVAPLKTQSVLLAEAIAPPPEETDFKSKMSIAMAKSWAKRRKKAAKKETV
jgi:hypothetical protein